MLQQGTAFTWYFTQPQLREISIFFSSVDRVYRLCRRSELSKLHFEVRTLSNHQTLEEATAAAVELAQTMT